MYCLWQNKRGLAIENLVDKQSGSRGRWNRLLVVMGCIFLNDDKNVTEGRWMT